LRFLAPVMAGSCLLFSAALGGPDVLASCCCLGYSRL